MTQSNTANGGTSFFDLQIQTVSLDAGQVTFRAVIYLTSLNVTDGINNLAVGGNWSRSGTLPLSGVYHADAVWSEDISFPRTGSAYTVNVGASWSTVEYWGTTLSASTSAVVPATGGVPGPPTVTVTFVEATRAGVATSVAPADNGSPVTLVNYRVHRASDFAHMGDGQGGYEGVVFSGLAPATAYLAYGQAQNAFGWGGFSQPGVPFTTLASCPSRPPAPTVDQVTQTTARVTFSPPASDGGAPLTVNGLQVSSDPAFGTGIVYNADTPVSAPSVQVTGLTPNTVYYARALVKNSGGVQCGNGVGTSLWSPTVTFTTAGGVRVWNGSAWDEAPVSVWNGTAWVASEVRVWNGTAWVLSG